MSAERLDGQGSPPTTVRLEQPWALPSEDDPGRALCLLCVRGRRQLRELQRWPSVPVRRGGAICALRGHGQSAGKYGAWKGEGPVSVRGHRGPCGQSGRLDQPVSRGLLELRLGRRTLRGRGRILHHPGGTIHAPAKPARSPECGTAPHRNASRNSRPGSCTSVGRTEDRPILRGRGIPPPLLHPPPRRCRSWRRVGSGIRKPLRSVRMGQERGGDSPAGVRWRSSPPVAVARRDPPPTG
ncbi:MAG: hypothetical protein MZV64_16635 [Ignavibacteriales bacterium]|nr:hypothetical protein [Ignavibacteriales bacterium]